MNRRRLWLSAAGVGALAGAAGFAFHLFQDAERGSADANPAAVQALLAAQLPDLTGRDHALETWRGRVLVINFWATWCAPCREEIPWFVRMQDRYGAQGLQFVGIAIDTPQQIADFARELSINYPLLVGGLATMALVREAGNRSGVLPFTLVLDRQGNLVNRYVGGVKEAKLEAVIKSLL